MSTLEKWDQFKAQFGPSYHHKATFEPMGIPGDEMFTHLCDLVVPKDNPHHAIKVQKRLFTLYEFTRTAMTQVGKNIRHSGDENITHPLSIAILLAEMGITDEDMIDAAILHDVPEDTDGIPKYNLNSIKNLINHIDKDTQSHRGESVARLVDTVSKVKTTVKTQRLQNIPDEKITEYEDQLTLRKLLYALIADPRAVIIKLGDVAHNAMTLSAMPESTQSRKARIFLDYYEPLARSFGLIGLARLIGDATLETVQKKFALAIKTARDNVMTYQKTKAIRQMANDWEFDSLKNKRKLNYEAISVDIPSIYEIYKKMDKSKTVKTDDLLPTLRITTNNRDDVWKWYLYLSEKYDFQEGESMKTAFKKMKNDNPVVKLIPFSISGKIYFINVEISPKIAEMMPVHQYIKGLKLTSNENKVIGRRMEGLRSSYQQSFRKNRIRQFSQSDLAHAEFRSRLKEGMIRFQDKDHKERAIKQGATYLDAAYEIGKNLGNNALSVQIKLPNKTRWIPRKLTDLIEPDVQCKFTARKIKRSIKYVFPDRYDMVNTPKAIQDIRSALKNRERNSKVEAIAHKRGGQILFWLYEMIRQKQPDISFDNVFNESLLQRKYGDLDTFKKTLGMISIPAFNNNYFPLWQDETEHNPQSLEAYHLAEDLVEFRKKLWTVRIKKIDTPGMLKESANIITKLGGNMLPVRTIIDPTDDQVTIQFTLTIGGPKLAHSIASALKEKYGREATIDVQKTKE